MYSVTILSALTTLALGATSLSLPASRQARQTTTTGPGLIPADTFLFIAKPIGLNPNPAALPAITNWPVVAVHSGAGLSTFVLQDPTTSPSPDLSAPGFFRNGTEASGMYLTAGDVIPGTPDSIVFATTRQAGSSNPGAQAGLVQLDFGVGTAGIDVLEGVLAVTYAEDFFYACPGVEVEGSSAIAVGVTNRYANPLAGCWRINLYAQCAGPISAANRAAFPAFQPAYCYENATLAAALDD